MDPKKCRGAGDFGGFDLEDHATALPEPELTQGSKKPEGNINNKKEADEKGIPNVAVSNGMEVVLTNSRGEYEIAVLDDTIVRVRARWDRSFKDPMGSA